MYCAPWVCGEFNVNRRLSVYARNYRGREWKTKTNFIFLYGRRRRVRSTIEKVFLVFFFASFIGFVVNAPRRSLDGIVVRGNGLIFRPLETGYRCCFENTINTSVVDFFRAIPTIGRRSETSEVRLGSVRLGPENVFH